ncbi:hypothetical protein AUP74_00100 [Microbulbifer aggregans]|uniref:Spore Coat Protein U domain protein n=1 Tax=Microbulbifer aggregans TaxID=1769779 RepID=A0A1C9W341_9GAMM|nr:hypothetical protein [Microbulbifer aggregans]AOS95576.1 hypothetical protein AUP74_00100 [Microbulbifer aggregans]
MKTSIRMLLTAIALAVATSTHAATDGVEGTGAHATSTGTVDVTLTITPSIIVTGFSDVDFNSSTTEVPQNICVGGTGFQEFSVDFASVNGNAVIGSGATDPFLMAGTTLTSETVPYSVEFANSAGASAGSGIVSTDGTTGANTFLRQASVADCETGGVTNATLILDIGAAFDFSALNDSEYTDVLTIQVSAN